MRAGCLEELLQPGFLGVRFQPILEESGGALRPHAVEGIVSGPDGSNFASPAVLVEYARRKGEEIRVDRACVSAVCDAARALAPDEAIAVGVHATTLARDHGFADFLCDAAARHDIGTRRLIVEVLDRGTARASLCGSPAVTALRGAGVRLSVGEVGSGSATLRTLVDCRPEYFKIDGYIVRGCRTDPYRQAVIESIGLLGREVSALIVADGVDDPGDMDELQLRGVVLFQGNLLAPPLTPEEWARQQGTAS